MSLDRVLATQNTFSRSSNSNNQSNSILAASKYQRPAIASTRAWIFDTEKLLNDIKYAEQCSQQMRGIASTVIAKDHKESKLRAARVDREVKGSVEKAAQLSSSLEQAIALHEAELVKLLQERSAAREALELVYAPMEQVRKRIELRIANPLPLEERTDTSVMESLQIVSKSLAEASRTLIAFVKDAERHCTHMESLRQAMRLEINDKFESMRVTYASSHEVPSLPPIHQFRSGLYGASVGTSGGGSDFSSGGGGGGGGATGAGGGGGANNGGGGGEPPRTEYAQMLKSDMLRCLRLSQAAIAESVLLRAKLSQCVKDITLVRKRNEKLLSVTLEAHVKDTEMLQRTLAERKAAVQAEIEKIQRGENEAHEECERLRGPSESASSKLRDHHRYARVLRDGRMNDSVSQATAEEASTLISARKDASKCEHSLAQHRQRLEGYLVQLSQAEKSKAKVMHLALSTKAGEMMDEKKVSQVLSSRNIGAGGVVPSNDSKVLKNSSTKSSSKTPRRKV